RREPARPPTPGPPRPGLADASGRAHPLSRGDAGSYLDIVGLVSSRCPGRVPTGQGRPGSAAPASRAARVRRPRPMNEVTRILSALESGEPQEAERLLPLVYDELRRLAAQWLAREQ